MLYFVDFCFMPSKIEIWRELEILVQHEDLLKVMKILIWNIN